MFSAEAGPPWSSCAFLIGERTWGRRANLLCPQCQSSGVSSVFTSCLIENSMNGASRECLCEPPSPLPWPPVLLKAVLCPSCNVSPLLLKGSRTRSTHAVETSHTLSHLQVLGLQLPVTLYPAHERVLEVRRGPYQGTFFWSSRTMRTVSRFCSLC